jgi:hypothetical protein
MKEQLVVALQYRQKKRARKKKARAKKRTRKRKCAISLKQCWSCSLYTVKNKFSYKLSYFLSLYFLQCTWSV